MISVMTYMHKLRIKNAVIPFIFIGSLSISSHAEDKTEIDIADIPSSVTEAAKFIVNGIKFEKAELKRIGKNYEYALDGIANEEQYEVEITTDKDKNIINIKIESVLELEDDNDKPINASKELKKSQEFAQQENS